MAASSAILCFVTPAILFEAVRLGSVAGFLGRLRNHPWDFSRAIFGLPRALLVDCPKIVSGAMVPPHTSKSNVLAASAKAHASLPLSLSGVFMMFSQTAFGCHPFFLKLYVLVLLLASWDALEMGFFKSNFWLAARPFG